ncbi:hypothetical protein [Streptomyces sp. IBSNAI001]|uniref:hypothetical protein n=1 Tax=Streptomyces sp. IBSNAI001 TaxID=3457499 RepID=UPI003FD32FFF
MFRMKQTIHTANGSTVTITRRGLEFDLETRNPRGEVISTVVMDEDDVSQLLGEADIDINGSAYDEGYRDGYDAAVDAA